MLGDIHIAEPGALIAFAGARVIQGTVKEELPEGFQKSEYLEKTGFVDIIIERKNLINKGHGDLTSMSDSVAIVAEAIFAFGETYTDALSDLDDEKSVAQIISKLEGWIILALKSLGIESNRDSRMQGVWVSGKKISSIGLSFLRWTSRHGFTINYDTPESRVEGLAGCGLDADTTTSLSRLGHKVSIEQLKEKLLQTMPANLDRQVVANN